MSSVDEEIPEQDRPALQQLTNEQATLVEELLAGDLETRADVVRWMQRAALHSLGQLGDGWFIENLRDHGTVAAFLGRPWGEVREEDVSDAWLQEHRRDIVMKDVLPAFQRATRTFRWSATEFIEYDEDEDAPDADDVDLDRQHPTMRPAVARMLVNQRHALETALAGFADVDAIQKWAHDVIEASYAEVEPDVIMGAYFDATVRAWMLGPDHGPAKYWRENWLAHYLLPAFNAADASLPSRAKEQPIDSSQQGHIPK